MSEGVRGGRMSDMSVMSVMSDTSKPFTAIEMDCKSRPVGTCTSVMNGHCGHRTPPYPLYRRMGANDERKSETLSGHGHE
jgi:hypothetical protein